MYVLTRHIDRRRAVLSVLLAARPNAVTLADIADRLANQGVEPLPTKQLSDILRHQVHRGNAIKRGRGLFAAGYLSRSSEWRTRNWRLLAHRADAEWRARHGDLPRRRTNAYR